MTSRQFGLTAGLVVVAVVIASGRWSLWAQAPKVPARPGNATRTPGRPEPAPEANSRFRPKPPTPAVSVQDALLRPCDIPFGRETSLAEVARYFEKHLNAPVVIDRAALDRQELTVDDTVLLELEGVRLKTGLKLLLDQLGLTYKVLAEDNILVLTDAKEADDRYGHILEELKALHRDIHDIQDQLDESLGVEDIPEGDGGRAMQIRLRTRRRPKS
jgi:hypothetical protein